MDDSATATTAAQRRLQPVVLNSSPPGRTRDKLTTAILHRRSPAHARSGQCLADHLELLRCYYNFIRPHMALRFGQEVRTPAMQAGLVHGHPTLRDVFAAVATLFSFF